VIVDVPEIAPVTERVPPIEVLLLKVLLVVTAPVPSATEMSLKPFSERTGPLKVVLAI
jgi:hypothetical protein